MCVAIALQSGGDTMTDTRALEPLSIAEEKKLREWVSHFLIATNMNTSTNKLHIPGDDGPICDHSKLQRTSKFAHVEWSAKETECYPIGHKDVCQYCANLWRETNAE
jgi:hypothetical protein